MNSVEFYKRISPIFRPECLRRKNVILVGLGSGGGRVATEVGRLGVQLTLIDLPGERLQEHNIVRHELGYSSLGKLKTTELTKHIHNLNPETTIECLEMDVTAQTNEFRTLIKLRRPDLLLVCTDNESSKHVITQIAFEFGVPVVGGAVYDGGVAGEVWRARPGAACYGCITAHLQQTATRPKKQLNIDYNSLNLPEIRSTCALNLDIAQIALIHARVALSMILDREEDLIGIPPQANLIVFANRLIDGQFNRPLHAEFFRIKRQPNCLICGQHSPEDVDSEAERIMRDAAEE